VDMRACSASDRFLYRGMAALVREFKLAADEPPFAARSRRSGRNPFDLPTNELGRGVTNAR